MERYEVWFKDYVKYVLQSSKIVLNKSGYGSDLEFKRAGAILLAIF